MKKKIKKAFTLVELLVVIAILAILATVSIVGYNSFTKKARVSNDTVLVKQMNDILFANSQTDGANPTMSKALEDVFDGGYDLTKLTPTTTNYNIMWDRAKDQMVLADENLGIVYPEASKVSENHEDLFVVVKNAEELSKRTNAGYSVYLHDDFTGTEITDLKAGIDTGKVTIVDSISYVGTGRKQDVVIRTNGGSLTINDTNNASHQYHYGSSANVTVATGTSCYECHAIVTAMKITEGKVIADRGAYVGIVEASSSVILEEENGGVFVIPTNVSTNKVPAAVASQIGYTNDGTTITASAEKAEKSYYVITSYADLTNFVDKWNSGLFPTSANVKFANNVTIDLGASEAWTPIGNWDHPFNGIFDGNGCVISGLTADATHQNYEHIFAENASVGNGETYGFFGIVGGGDTLIKNLTLKDVNIDLSSANNVGALIGYVPNNSKFQETSVTEKWKNDSEIGTHKVTISGVSVTGSVSANSHVSGFIGKNYSSGDISFSDCHNYAAVSGKVGYIGGLIGIQNNSSIQSISIINCTNNGNITKTGPDTGTECCAAGLVARVVGSTSTKVTITNCKNTGNITSIYSAYAYVHINTADTPSITGCTNTGTLTHGDGYNSFE